MFQELGDGAAGDLAEDDQLDKHSLLTDGTPPSAKAFRLGLRAGIKSAGTPPELSFAR
jgi:hypothetical protein